MIEPNLVTEGAETAGEHAMPALMGLTPPMWIALAMIVVIGILIWKKVPAAVGKALDHKIAAIRDQLDEAKALRAEAEALKGEYAAKAAAAESDAKAMVERARQEADGLIAKAREDADAMVERRTRMAEAKISQEEQAAIQQVRAAAANAAARAAALLIAEQVDADTDSALIDKAIGELGSR